MYQLIMLVLLYEQTILHVLSVHISTVQMWLLSWGLHITGLVQSCLYAPHENCNFMNSLDYAINRLPSKEPPIPSQLLNLFSPIDSQYIPVSCLSFEKVVNIILSLIVLPKRLHFFKPLKCNSYYMNH
jgi:hypothetical protein